MITGAGAALNRANVRHGQNVAVFGVGGIGLNVIQAAKLCDAGRIIAVDTLPQKEELAMTFGATDFVLAGPRPEPGQGHPPAHRRRWRRLVLRVRRPPGGHRRRGASASTGAATA